MKTILIYFVLFAFWMETAVGFKLTHVKGLSLLNLSIYLLLIAWALSLLSKGKLFEPNNVNKYILLMIFVVLASIPVKMLLCEVQNIRIVNEVIGIKNWANPFILFFILFNVIDDDKTCKKALLGLVVLLILTVSTMLLVSFVAIKFGAIKVIQETRSAGFAEPNQYATYLVLFFPLLLTSCIFQKSIKIKAAASVFCVIVLIGLLSTASRGGMLSFFFSMACYSLILMRKKMISTVSLLIVLVGVILMGVTSFVVAPTRVQQTAIERFDPAESKDFYEYTSGRTMLFSNGIKIFMESPIFGHGKNTFIPLIMDRFKIRGNSHNDYLLYAVHYGIIGLVIFIMIFVKVFQYVWYHLKIATDSWSKQLYISYIAGFAGYTFSMLGVNLIQPRFIFWIYTAVIYKYALLELKKRD